MDNIYDVIILGYGPAGLNAAIYAKRYGMTLKIIGRDAGIIAETGEVENYLGIYPINGFELTQKYIEHAKALGVEVEQDEITKIEKKDNIFIVNDKHKAKTLIYALGGDKRKLDLEEEKTYRGKGIAYCATCDAAFYKKKTVAVLGGGNSAFESVKILNKFADKIYLVHRRDQFKAHQKLVDEIKALDKVEFVLNSVVTKVTGDNKVEAMIVKDKDNNEKEIKVDGIFVEFGYEANTDLASNIGVELKNNMIDVKADMSTNIEGFFAAGDCTNGSNVMWQLITAAAEGAIAAESAFKFSHKQN